MKQFNQSLFLFSIGFILLGLAALQIPLTHLTGSKASFTVFDAFGPTAGGFIETFPAAIAVFLMQLFNFLLHGAHVQDMGTFIRFIPMVFATIYFSKKSRFNFIVPILAIMMFVLNPIGRTVWYFSLFWLIPIICYFWQEKSLFIQSLGATFTAHAVGGVLWIYFFHLPKTAWIALIPVVALERLVFALGITLTYLIFNNALNFINKKNILPFRLPANPQHVWGLV